MIPCYQDFHNHLALLNSTKDKEKDCYFREVIEDSSVFTMNIGTMYYISPHFGSYQQSKFSVTQRKG